MDRFVPLVTPSDRPAPRRLPRLLVALLLAGSAVRADVAIEGLERPLATNARALMQLDGVPCDAAPWRVARLFEAAEGDLRRSLEAFGYYRPEIDSSLTTGDDCWNARFVVDPGVPVRLRGVTVDVTGPGAGEPAWRRLREASPLEPGVILRHDEYDVRSRLQRS